MNAIYLPMVFISGVFFSVERMPGFLEAIANVSPLTYLLELDPRPVHRGRAIYRRGRTSPFSARGASPGSSSPLRVFRWEPREG